MKEGYKLCLVGKGIFAKEENGKNNSLFCPHCDEDLTANSSDAVIFGCPKCKNSLKADEDEMKQLLVQENLEEIIPILEEKDLLKNGKLSTLKPKDIKKLKLNKEARKKLVKVLDISGYKGYVVYSILGLLGIALVIGLPAGIIMTKLGLGFVDALLVYGLIIVAAFFVFS